MTCPFVARLPSAFLKNYAPTLMNQYVDQCPFLIKRGIASTSTINEVHARYPVLDEKATFEGIYSIYIVDLHKSQNYHRYILFQVSNTTSSSRIRSCSRKWTIPTGCSRRSIEMQPPFHWPGNIPGAKRTSPYGAPMTTWA